MIKIKHPYLLQIFSVALLAFSIVFAGSSYNFVSAAEPGCYRVVDGEPQRLNSCPTNNAVYDDGRGANISPPNSNTDKCFVYSENLYDGDASWGEPFVQVSCDALNPCPAGSELRYSNEKLGPPSCVDENTETSDQFAGGADLPSSTNNNANNGSSGFGCSSGSSADECTPISPGGAVNTSDGRDGKQCGKQADDGSGSEVILSIDIGCVGESWPKPLNPIIDMAFAFIRFLSAGVGLVIIASIIWAGIQYSVSRGNPQSTEAAISRVTNTFFALMLYIFIFAIANFLVPGGMFL